MKTKRFLLRSGTKAVTIMEICVVVLIISVLAILLFPLVKGAAERSRAVACTQNLRQISSLLHGLIGDTRGKLYLFRDGNIEGKLRWYNQLKAYANLPELEAKKLFGCPSMKRDDVSDWYCYGLRTGGSPGKRETLKDAAGKTAGVYALYVTAVQEPAKFLMMADTIGSGGKQTFRIIPPGLYSNAGIQIRHMERTNVLFLDGHVEALRATDLNSYGITEVLDMKINIVKTKGP